MILFDWLYRSIASDRRGRTRSARTNHQSAGSNIESDLAAFRSRVLVAADGPHIEHNVAALRPTEQPRLRHRGTFSAVLLYATFVTVVLGTADFFYARWFFPPLQPTSVGTTGLINRLAWYEPHRGEYNLVFLGDSRTYCGIHPELLDPLLNTSSLNLASFSNWFPTQLPLVQQLAPLIPKETTVVWSVGVENFETGTGVQRVFPVGIANALRYLAWGLPSTGLADNVFYYNPALYFLSTRGEIRQNFTGYLDQPLQLDGFAKIGAAIIGNANANELAPNKTAVAPERTNVTEDQVRELKEQWLRDPRVASVGVVRDQGRPTALTIYFQRGSYYRVELDTAFFRAKQREFTGSYRGQLPTIEPVYWRLFEDILQTFSDNGVQVVVSEFEEAPFIYGSPEHRRKWRDLMRNTVEKRVREFGFKYVRVNFDKLSDDDYFDYNHLNSRGAEVFTPMLADQLRPYFPYGVTGSEPARQ